MLDLANQFGRLIAGSVIVRGISLFGCVVLVALLVGCDRGVVEQPGGATTVGEAVTVTDGAGRELSFLKAPERIISLSPAVTEVLFALVESDRLVGRTRYCLWPASALTLPVVGGISDPNVETILNLRPDLVIVSKLSNREIVDQLEGLGIPTMVCAFQTVDDVAREMRMIAEVCQSGPEAMAFVDEFMGGDPSLEVDAEPRLRVLLLLGIQGLYSAGEGSYAGQVIEMAGGENLANRTGIAWPQVSTESLLEWMPEVVVVAVDHGVERNGRVLRAIDEWKTTEPWKRLPAVLNDRVLLMNDSIMTIPGPRLAQAVEKIRAFLRANDSVRP